MAELDQIRERIRDIAARKENVMLSEITWVVDRLKEHGYRTSCRDAKHGKLFGVGTQRFMVNVHNRGNKQVKPYSIRAFANAMIDLGLYED